MKQMFRQTRMKLETSNEYMIFLPQKEIFQSQPTSKNRQEYHSGLGSAAFRRKHKQLLFQHIRNQFFISWRSLKWANSHLESRVLLHFLSSISLFHSPKLPHGPRWLPEVQTLCPHCSKQGEMEKGKKAHPSSDLILEAFSEIHLIHQLLYHWP